MSDPKAPPAPAPPPPPRIYHEEWSSICPGDLGLKAGYLTPAGMASFRRIVGWVTWNGRDPGETSTKHGFFPIVVNDRGALCGAWQISCDYLGTFDVSLTEEEALKKSEEWRGSAQPQEPTLINVPGLGKA